MSNDTVNEHVYIVNKRLSISEKTGDLNRGPKQLRSEIMNYMLPRHRRKNKRRKVNRMHSHFFDGDAGTVALMSPLLTSRMSPTLLQ